MFDNSFKGSFFESIFVEENKFQNIKQFLMWFNSKKRNDKFIVEKIPFKELKQWSFANDTLNIRHSSKKFFTIEGLSVKTNFGDFKNWEQPIINQPEVGILGIITKVFDNTRYFLMQVKMEPGNINLLQLSPTVQATKSNFTQVHNGKLPTYLGYFIDNTKSKIIIDQLQPEQGGRFLKKRNRNMIVEVEEDIPMFENFCWLTLNNLKKLFLIDNFVNMDARSVFATINTLIYDEISNNILDYNIFVTENGYSLGKYENDVIISLIEKKKSWKSTNALISWLTNLKTQYELNINRIPLKGLTNWEIGNYEIKHAENKYFTIIAVSVKTGLREVSSWTQPLIAESKIGLIGFLTTKINGVLHYLVQGKVEPGNIDVVDIAPTVSCSDINRQNNKIYFLDYFVNANSEQIRYSKIQSEEGGRFYHFQNKNMILEVENIEINNIPNNFTWMTLNQLRQFQRFGLVNIEARNLISFSNLF